jgi:hypothetical protein
LGLGAAAWSSGIVSGCHGGDWSYGSPDRIPPGILVLKVKEFWYRRIACKSSESFVLKIGTGFFGERNYQKLKKFRFPISKVKKKV